GDILFSREDYRNAASAYERALARCANDAASTADIWHSYGSTLISLGRFGEALAAFDKGAAIVSGRVRPINGRGVILSRIGRHEAALAWYEATLLLRPSANVLSNKAEALASLGRLDEADAILDEASAMAPDAMAVWAVRGIVATSRGRHDEALAAFNRAIALGPRHAPNYAELARLLLALGDVEHACEVAERALALDPYDARAWQVKAQALRALGQEGDADAAERHGATLLAEQTAEVDAWLRARAARDEPLGPA
ncbi:MAG: tetratricopeptide repeat protein, partial [Chloroflexota bacterium]|nr:tetratricopeptide repeat protein [Chloroflexota bacterium]